MASQWYSLVSQKLFMARVLLRQADTPSSGEDASDALQREAGLQGSIELTLRARRLLLIMVAKLYQQKQSDPGTLEALVALLGEDNPETAELLTLARKGGSWWNHLDQLEVAQAKPPATRKTVSAENIIAISADSGPDRSAAALGKVLDALKQFADTLEERHSEW